MLKKGGIAVMPTDTLYGVVGSALSRTTVERIYELKGRNEKKPFIILILKIADLEKFGIKDIPSSELKKYWPGKVSIILPLKRSSRKEFEYLHRGTNSLAFRLPDKKSLIEILKKTGPLVAPSANPEGLPPAENITEAKKYFGDEVDAYIAGGKLTGKASKIISISENGEVSILRK